MAKEPKAKKERLSCPDCPAGSKTFRDKKALGGHKRMHAYMIKKEAATMNNEPCKNCVTKQTELETLTGKLTAASEQLEDKTTETVELQAALEKKDLPAMDEFLKHCTTCPSHGQQLESYRQGIVNEVIGDLGKPESRNQVLDIMKAHNIEPGPEKIVITGLEV